MIHLGAIRPHILVTSTALPSLLIPLFVEDLDNHYSITNTLMGIKQDFLRNLICPKLR